MRCNNILEAVGHTPLVRLNRLATGFDAEVYVKADYMNPGGSVKDRIGIWMIDEAEKRGALKPGGTIIEGTSGNTGIGLALVGAVRGYKLVFTITDKQSKEKVDLLKALGAEVIVCPTAVEPDDPRSYYSVAKKLAQEIPNSFYPNQYENPDEPRSALPDHRPGNLGGFRRENHAFRLRHGHGRNDQRRGPLPEGKKSRRKNYRRRSDRIAVLRICENGKSGQGKNVCRRRHRRGYFSVDDEFQSPRRRGAGERPGMLHLGAAPGEAGGNFHGRLGRRLRFRRACAWRRRCRRDLSWSRSCPIRACAI